MPAACAKLSTGKRCLILAGWLLAAVGCSDTRQVTDTAQIPLPAAADAPIVIAHRGASGHRPEHTLEAYRYALLQGADFIETDLVATGDGVLIARHENLLAEVVLDEDGAIRRDAAGSPEILQATTDVAEHPEFADRLTVKRVDGRLHAGWFSEDFTLAEIRTLGARERLPGLRPLNALHDDVYGVPTLAEIIRLVKQHTAAGRRAGLYIEIKHPTYFRYAGRRLDGGAIGIDLGATVLDELRRQDFVAPAQVYLQSFEVDSLLSLKRQMAQAGLSLPLVQLFGDLSNARYRARPFDLVYHAGREDDLEARYGELTLLLDVAGDVSYAELAAPDVIAWMAANYASALGPPKQNVLLVEAGVPVDVDGDGRALQRAVLTGATGAIVALAAAHDLELHPYTLRLEEPFLIRDGDRVLPLAEEARRLLDAGATGFFIDQPAEGIAAVAEYQKHQPAAESR